MIYKVTFHRTYEVSEELIRERLISDGLEEDELTEQVLECEAENIARSYIDEEMSEFTDSSIDFVSATIEKIEV